MPVKKLSEIALSSSPPAFNDTLVGVTTANVDQRTSVLNTGMPRATADMTFYISTTGDDATAIINDPTHPYANYVQE